MALFGPPHNADAPHAGLAEGALRRLYERAGLPLQVRVCSLEGYISISLYLSQCFVVY